ncbi:MAG: WhiB family transcriptional regulator [Acidimicrobiia bacterium]
MYALLLPATWQQLARCRFVAPEMAARFFSDDPEEINAAKTFCATCPVRAECLADAIARREPCGVWGGELILGGKVVAEKRRRGRPRKERPDIVPEREPAVA